MVGGLHSGFGHYSCRAKGLAWVLVLGQRRKDEWGRALREEGAEE